MSEQMIAPEEKVTLASLGARRRELVTKKDELNELLKDINEETKAIDSQLLSLMADQGIDRTAIEGIGIISVSKKDVVAVNDWDAYHQYVVENNMPYLLQRRPMNNAVLELLAEGEKLPFVDVDTIPSIGFRRN